MDRSGDRADRHGRPNVPAGHGRLPGPGHRAAVGRGEPVRLRRRQPDKEAQAKLKEAESWQEKADSEFKLAAQDAGKALHTWPWDVPGDLYDAGKAATAGAVDEARAVAAFAEYGALEAKALALQIASDVAHAAAKTAALLAKGADKAAQIAGKVADAAGRTAQTLEAVAARDSAAASSADSAFKSLAAAYARQEAHKIAKIAKATVRVLKKAGHAVARAAVAVAKAAYKYSGAQDVVGCVTHPSLAGCAKAALTVALVVGTAGEGEVAEIGLNAAEHVGEDVAENAGEHAAEEVGGDAAEDAGKSCPIGGQSFTAGTKVLLANGEAVPIASLKPGDKVLATNTKTGKTQAETISVVMIHQDTNLYDLKIKARGRTAVIDTTSNHPFWDATTHRWAKAAALKYGTRLRTPAGGTATVLGGYTPPDRTGWMWDLTIPGDHDFYIDTTAADVLVHNCGPGQITGYTTHGLNSAISHDGVGVSPSAMIDAVKNPISIVEQSGGRFRYIGQNAAVVLSRTGRVVTTWARNRAGWRMSP